MMTRGYKHVIMDGCISSKNIETLKEFQARDNL